MANPLDGAADDALAAALAAQATLGEGETPAAPVQDSGGDEDRAEAEHKLCAICSTVSRCVVWTACGHCVTCEACHGEVMTRGRKCVLCNLPILDGGFRVVALGTSQGAPLQPVQTYMPEAIDEAAAERAHAAVVPRRPTAQQLQQLQERLRELAAVVAVEGGDAELLLRATRDLRVMLSQQDDGRLDTLVPAAVREDIPRRMVRLLERQQDEDILDLHMEAVRVLVSITVGVGGADGVMDAGAVPHLLRLAASPNEEMQDQALVALGNIAGDGPRSRDRLHGFGVVAPVLALLENDTASLGCTRIVAWVLSNFCRGKPAPSFSTVSPALPALARMLRSDDAQVLTDTCWALSYLSDGTNDKIAAVIDAGVCGRLVELTTHPDPDVIVPALRAAGNLVTGHDEQTQTVLDHGVLPRLLTLLEGPYDRKIKKEACWAISNITAGNKAQIQAIVDANLVPPLIRLLGTAEFDVKKETAWAISNATSGGTHLQLRPPAVFINVLGLRGRHQADVRLAHLYRRPHRHCGAGGPGEHPQGWRLRPRRGRRQREPVRSLCERSRGPGEAQGAATRNTHQPRRR